MAYNDIIGRSDISALIPEQVNEQMLAGAAEQSFVLSTFTNVPVTTNQTRFPVLSALPTAAWVSPTDTGLKETTSQAWDNKYINIEELAAIVPIPESVLADAGDAKVWSQVMPRMQEAAAILIDTSVVIGTGAPSSFPDSIVDAATAAGNTATLETRPADEGGVIGDHSDMLEELEADGYSPDGGLAAKRFRKYVRQARGTTGERLAEVNLSKDSVEIDGVTYTTRAMPGVWSATSGEPALIAIDSSEFVVGVRQDVTWKLLDQAVIQDGSGAIQYNLAQQDMVALRMVMRVGWQVANTINRDQPTEASRYPAALLLNA